MNCGKIMERLEQEYPPALAEKWDNPGLQVGRREQDVKSVYLALDLTDEVLEHAVKQKADLIITHHPLLIGGIMKINSDDFHGRKILTLAEHQMSHFAMHTNYDVCEMGSLCAGYLGLTEQEVLETAGIEWNGQEAGIGTVGSLPEKMTLSDCAEAVKQAFDLEWVKVFGDLNCKVSRVALCPGSGKSMIGAALAKKAEVYITGDIGHHEGMDAAEQGMAVIDAGHYGLEHVFIPQMEQFMKKNFPELKVMSEPLKGPFRII